MRSWWLEWRYSCWNKRGWWINCRRWSILCIRWRQAHWLQRTWIWSRCWRWYWWRGQWRWQICWADYCLSFCTRGWHTREVGHIYWYRWLEWWTACPRTWDWRFHSHWKPSWLSWNLDARLQRLHLGRHTTRLRRKGDRISCVVIVLITEWCISIAYLYIHCVLWIEILALLFLRASSQPRFPFCSMMTASFSHDLSVWHICITIMIATG